MSGTSQGIGLVPGWTCARMRDIGTWYGGGTPSKHVVEFWDSGSIPWISPKDMGSDVLEGTRDHITESAIEASSAKLVPPESVALVVRSGILERMLPVAFVPFSTTLNQDMKAVVAKDGVDPRWIAWGLRAFEGQLLRDTRKAGTTVASLEMPRLYDFKIPLPPLDEQRRIVAILDSQLSHLDSANSSVAETLVLLDDLRSAELARLVSWDGDTVTVGDLAEVGTGTTPSRSVKSYYDGGTIPWATSGDLHQGLVTDTPQKITEQGRNAGRLKVYPQDTLLVAMYGEGKTRGTVARLGISATVNQACAAIQVKESDLVGWVEAVLQANYSAMRNMASGGVQPNLNLGLVRAIPVPLPPRATQQARLNRLNLIMNELARVKKVAQASLCQSEALRRSLLAAAFRGELTADWRAERSRPSNVSGVCEDGGLPQRRLP